MAIRKILSDAYSRRRGLADGIDGRIPVSGLMSIFSRRLFQRLCAISQGYPSAFISHSAQLRCKRLITVGRDFSIGSRASIDGLSTQGIIIGDRVTIDTGAILRASGVIRKLGVGICIGNRTAVGAFNLILGQGGVIIGDDCLLGPNVTILSENHVFEDGKVPIREQGERRDTTVIDDDVWLGAGVTILAGAKIGRGSIVAAGAVVRGEVEPFSIVGGIPAKKIGQRSNANI